MKKIGFGVVFCLVFGMYGCSQNDAGTSSNSSNSNNNAVAAQKSKDSLLNAASKLNTPDSTKGTSKDSDSQSH